MRLHFSVVVFAPLVAAALATVAVLSFVSPSVAGAQGGAGNSSVFRLSDDDGMNLIVVRCVGMGSSSDVVQHRDGTSNTVMVIPGATKPSRVACERSLTADLSLSEWRNSIVTDGGPDTFRSLRITMFDSLGEPVAEWTLDSAWPSDLTVIPAADGGLREVVTFASERVTRVQP